MSKNSLKQGTLFSFFAKKPKSDEITTPKNTTASTSAAPTSNQTRTNTTTEGVSAPAGPSIGTRIEVLWPNDDEYYVATVTAVAITATATRTTVRYDDGTVEILDLSKETWRLLMKSSEESKKGSRSHKRIIVERQGEDTDEYEFLGDDDDDEDYSSDEENMEDEENFFDNSEDDEPVVRKRLSKSNGKTQRKRRLVKISSKNKGSGTKKTDTSNTWTVSQNDDDEQAEDKKKLANTCGTFLSPVLQRFAANSTSAVVVTATKPKDGNKKGTTKPLVTPPPSTLMSISHKQQPISMENEKGGIPATGMFQEGEVNVAGTHVHNHLTFLYPPKLRDARGNLYNTPDYDPRTLKFGPAEEAEICKYLKSLTPASKQWWEIKSKYMDTILFFKTGKFYEIYHMDADVACRELGFVYMKGAIAHSGFPESAYGQMSGRLISKGYKVARVEQTETPEQLAERKKITSGKKPQVVNREVCSIISSGTRTFCFIDDPKGLLNDDEELSRVHGPLLSIKETLLTQEEGGAHCEYGITIVDAVRSIITVGQFADDILRSRMLTLLTTFSPSEILLEEGVVSKELVQLIQMTQTARIEKIRAQEEFPQSTAILESHRKALSRPNPCHPWDPRETVEELSRKRYFEQPHHKSKKHQQQSVSENDWPEVLRACVEGGALLALSSIGSALFYLQRAMIDEEIFNFGCIKAYVPPGSPVVNDEPIHRAQISEADEDSVLHNGTQGVRTLCELSTVAAAAEDGLDSTADVGGSLASRHSEGKSSNHQHAVSCAPGTDHMQIDGTTIENLELLFNQADKTSRNSLWAKLNYTKTPHGFRLLRVWLLRPLFRRADIHRRQDAVAELCTGSAALAMSEARPMLQKVGDLERLLSRVHAMGGSGSSLANPNERAMLYEGATYTQRKINDFQKLIDGLRSAGRVMDLFSPEKCGDISSGLLRKIVRRQNDGGCFPDNLEEELNWFRDNSECFDDEYYSACADIERIERELENYKIQTCRQLGRNSLSHWKYINTQPDSRDKYLIELPVSIPVPQDFYIKAKRGSGAKQVNKYRTSIVEDLVNALEAALDEKKAGKERSTQLLFQKFDSLRAIWTAAAHATAMLDALGSLAFVSSMPDMVRPTILDENGSPMLHYQQGRHFCVDVTHDGGGFIPNDLMLGGDEESSARVLLLSGPNMGGKSTMLRQTCLIAIMAQIGCFVPATECSLTPLDRIFTRLGASDRILSGQSTFFVELAETAAALRGATRRSLVIMDELGRGTSTFDGTAIASATVQHLVEASGCLVMFATHYHTLLDDWKETSAVRLGHMECLVEDGDENNNSNITFLYTLGEGVCPKSFGINVARLAGLPEEVLKIAEQKSRAFEDELSSGAAGMSEEERLIKDLTSAVEAGDVAKAERLWKKMRQNN